MTSPWPALRLDPEQAEIRDWAREVARAVGPVPEDAGDAVADGVVAELRASGMWTLAVPAEHGGGGGELPVLLLALHELSRRNRTAAVAVLHQHAAAADDDLARAVVEGAVAVYAEAFDPSLSRSVGTGTPARVRVDTGLRPDRVLVRAADSLAVHDAAAVLGGLAPVERRTGLAGLGTAFGPAPSDQGTSRTDSERSAAARRTWRLGLAACAAGCAAESADTARRYVHERHQFGAALRTIPQVQVRVARLLTEAAAAWHPAWSAAQDRGPATESAAATALTARRCLDAALSCVMTALGLHGGYGYLDEYPPADLVRDALSLQAASGLTTDVLARAASTLDGAGG